MRCWLILCWVWRRRRCPPSNNCCRWSLWRVSRLHCTGMSRSMHREWWRPRVDSGRPRIGSASPNATGDYSHCKSQCHNHTDNYNACHLFPGKGGVATWATIKVWSTRIVTAACNLTLWWWSTPDWRRASRWELWRISETRLAWCLDIGFPGAPFLDILIDYCIPRDVNKGDPIILVSQRAHHQLEHQMSSHQTGKYSRLISRGKLCGWQNTRKADSA
jgi:hypothetical protein